MVCKGGTQGKGHTGQVTSCALDGILPAALECLALLSVCFWALAVRLCDEIFDRGRPIYFVCSLLGDGNHRRLVGRHGQLQRDNDCAYQQVISCLSVFASPCSNMSSTSSENTISQKVFVLVSLSLSAHSIDSMTAVVCLFSVSSPRAHLPL